MNSVSKRLFSFLRGATNAPITIGPANAIMTFRMVIVPQQLPQFVTLLIKTRAFAHRFVAIGLCNDSFVRSIKKNKINASTILTL